MRPSSKRVDFAPFSNRHGGTSVKKEHVAVAICTVPNIDQRVRFHGQRGTTVVEDN
ncbi:MAG: hypothetical protein GY696_21115 [Gammaproteobacteria bacterium]|nr:hypothetical protein [Gammaproteobacteria bacterium]